MITRLVSSVHHRRCHCPVTQKTVEVRIRDIETIKQQENWHGHIRILSRTLEDCSGISECGIIRTTEGGNFLINWQCCPLSASLQTGLQVWNSCLPISSFSPSMYEAFSWEGIT